MTLTNDFALINYCFVKSNQSIMLPKEDSEYFVMIYVPLPINNKMQDLSISFTEYAECSNNSKETNYFIISLVVTWHKFKRINKFNETDVLR